MKKRITLSILLLSLCFAMSYAQKITVSGTVLDRQSGEILAGADIKLEDSQIGTVTDASGDFSLSLRPSEGDRLIIHAAGHEDFIYTFGNNLTTDIELGEISLSTGDEIDGLNAEDIIPTVTLSNADFEDDFSTSQNISGILTASRDVFVSAAAFQFGPRRFRIRGLDSENTMVLINGAPMNDIEVGRPSWSAWGGLNDVTRNRTNSVGLAATSFDFGGVGGASKLETRASRQRKQFRVSYAVSNRSYRNRVMMTYSTGMQRNGWAFSLSGSHRWANEGYNPGTPYDAWSYFGSVERKFNDKHSLALTVFGAPITRGRSTAATNELYQIAGTNYYNPFWGEQNGRKRNSRIGRTNQPIGILTHDWNLSKKTHVLTAVSYQAGRNGSTAIDWYNTTDPRPDYYQKAPSFQVARYESATLEQKQLQNYLDNPEDLQVNWDLLYQANRNNIRTIDDVNGIEGNSVTGKRAHYLVEERRFDSKKINFNTIVEHTVSDNLTLQGGIRYQYYKGENFKVVEDLLGADFTVDLDPFADREAQFGDDDFAQNNIETPNRIVREGDRWGWDYDSDIHKATGWAQVDVSLKKWDFFAALEVSNTRFWRTGNNRNGRFPENSFGKSEEGNFTNYSVKGGVTYKIDGRNYLYANAMTGTRAPYFRNSYILPRLRNQLTPGLTDEKISSFEGGYQMRSPLIKARATAYFVEFKDRFSNRPFFLDAPIRNVDGTTTSAGGFINYLMRDIDVRHIGVELAANIKVTSTLNIIAVAAIGEYIHTSRPETFIISDQGFEVVMGDRVYVEDFKVPNTAQSAYTFGFNYNSPKYWFANINFNYLHRVHLDFFPERRTLSALEQPSVAEIEFFDGEHPTDYFQQGSEIYEAVYRQEETDGGFSVDIFGGKSFKVDDYFIYLTVGLSNILDDQDFVTGGFEQFRYRGAESLDEFPNRYFYAWGVNYFAQVALRF